jgi:beta-xylosidase
MGKLGFIYLFFAAFGQRPNTCTGEGSFIIYHDGYYYLYTAFGVNEYNYTTRIFRSTSPTGPFTDYNGVSATTTSQVHGTQTMAPHYVAIDDYVYASTGHGSLYNAVNNNGETILVYAAHGRPISNNANDYKEIPDAAMVTRQKGQFIGNITVNYPTFYTQSGWTISMPEMYNGTDTSKNIKASQMDGIYASSTLNDVIDTNLKYSSKAKPSGYSTNWDFSHQVYFSHETETTGVVYSTDSINVNYTYELSYDSENPAESTTTYITIKNGNTVMAEGVVAMHNGSPEIAFFNKNQITLGSETVKASTTVWSVKTSDLVHADYTALDSAYAEGDTLLKSLTAKQLSTAQIQFRLLLQDSVKLNQRQQRALHGRDLNPHLHRLQLLRRQRIFKMLLQVLHRFQQQLRLKISAHMRLQFPQLITSTRCI